MCIDYYLFLVGFRGFLFWGFYFSGIWSLVRVFGFVVMGLFCCLLWFWFFVEMRIYWRAGWWDGVLARGCCFGFRRKSWFFAVVVIWFGRVWRVVFWSGFYYKFRWVVLVVFFSGRGCWGYFFIGVGWRAWS